MIYSFFVFQMSHSKGRPFLTSIVTHTHTHTNDSQGEWSPVAMPQRVGPCHWRPYCGGLLYVAPRLLVFGVAVCNCHCPVNPIHKGTDPECSGIKGRGQGQWMAEETESWKRLLDAVCSLPLRSASAAWLQSLLQKSSRTIPPSIPPSHPKRGSPRAPTHHVSRSPVSAVSESWSPYAMERAWITGLGDLQVEHLWGQVSETWISFVGVIAS